MSESPVSTPVISNLVQAMPPGSGGWVSIDYFQVERLVAEWFKYPNNNLGILIHAMDSKGNNLAVTSQTAQGSGFVSICLGPG